MCVGLCFSFYFRGRGFIRILNFSEGMGDTISLKVPSWVSTWIEVILPAGTWTHGHLCVSEDDGGEGHGVRACLTCGLVGWLAGWFVCWVDDCLGAAQFQPGNSLLLSLSVSLSFPGVTGWDIKTGVLINCATLPPAALNMFWPWQAVSQTTDSLALFLFYIPPLCIIFHSFTSLSHLLSNLEIWPFITSTFAP